MTVTNVALRNCKSTNECYGLKTLQKLHPFQEPPWITN